MRTLALAARVALLGVLVASCDRSDYPTGQNIVAPCLQGPCQRPNLAAELDDKSPKPFKGGWLLARTFQFPCRLEVSWPFWQPSARLFAATVSANLDDVFPLPDGFFKLTSCNDLLLPYRDPVKHQVPPGAVVSEVSPEFAPSPLAPGDVFIPLGGAATLDGGFQAASAIEWHAATNARVSVTVWILQQPDPAAEYHLHVGEDFRWSDRRATVVRIVESQPHVSGWVEVRLSG